MYIQEGYSLSCDALTKIVKVSKDPLEVDLSRKGAQNAWTFRGRGPILLDSWSTVTVLKMSASSDSPHLERVLGLRSKFLDDASNSEDSDPKLRASVGT